MTAPASAPVGFRTSPQNIEAEQALLGAILINNSAWHEVAEFLRPEHFYEPVHQRIFAAASRLLEAGRIADHLTLKVEFDGDDSLRGLDGAQYLARMAMAAVTILNAGDYGRLIHDLARRRALIAICEEAMTGAYDPQAGVAAADQIQRAQGKLDRLSMDQTVEAWRSLGEVLDGIAHRLAAPEETFPTGLPTLDRSLAGGIQPGLVYGIEGRMKSGKTLVMGTCALSLIRQSVPFLYIALEMGAVRILERLVAHETGCNAVRFRKRQDPEDLASRVSTFVHRHGQRRGYFADEPGISFDRLKRLAHAAVVKLGVRVLFVDYWQLIAGAGDDQNRAEFLTEVAQWLAAFAPANNCAVVIGSQENRNGHSFGSDGLAKACDWLSVLHKVDVDDRAVGEIEGIWMDVKFNRDGDDGALGSEQAPAFRIDKIGPVLREYGDWSRPA